MYFSKTFQQITILVIALIVEAAIIHTCHYSPAPMQDNTEQVETSEWVNNAGDIVESVKADPSYFAQHDKELLDSVAKVYNTKPKKVIEYVVIHEQGESDIPQSGKTAADYMPVDSNKKDCPPEVKSLSADFSNPYYDAHVKIANVGSSDTSSLHISSRDTLTMLWKWVPEGNIFHRTKKLQLDISNANPDNKVYIDHAYRITEKPKRWAIGLQLGYGVYMKGIPQFVPYAGVGITKTIIRF